MSSQNRSRTSTDSRTGETAASAPARYVQTMDLAFLGSLVPGIIHNMATPLSGVLGATQLLEKRVSSFETLLKEANLLDDPSHPDLMLQLERNRTNVEILAKNAKHLADILQVVVHRINRGSVNTPEFHLLPDLVRSELRFLEANLVFKHKVKKQIEPLSDVPLTRFVYGYVAAAIDEFVSGTLALQDPEQNQMEMSFFTDVAPTDLIFVMRACFSPRRVQPFPTDLLDPCLERLREDGWETELLDESGCRELRMTRKRLLPAP
jgi:hypothetical protein